MLEPVRVRELSVLSTGGLLVLLLGLLPPVMDVFIVNVALPTLSADLGGGDTRIELVVVGYGAAFAVMLVLSGRLGDRFGRRRVLAAGLAGFGLASLWCGLADSMTELIAGRVVQGAFAALIPPQVLATVRAATPRARRARAVSWYTSVSGFAATFALLAGGLLLAEDIVGMSWRAVFLVNVPIGLAVLAGIARSVPETRSEAPGDLDPIGAGLLAVVLLAALIPATRAAAAPWTVPLLLVIPVAAMVLWRWEIRLAASGRIPLVPPELVRTTAIRRGLLLLAPFLAVGGGFLFAFPLTMQDGFGFGPLAGGLATIPMSAAFFAVSFAVPRSLARFGTATVTAGLILQPIGLALILGVLHGMSVTPWTIAPGMALVGCGQALVIGGVNASVMAAVPAEVAGVGGGALIMVHQGAIAIGTAIVGTVYTTLAAAHGHAAAFSVVIAVQIALALALAAVSGFRR
ncbi:MFS transporter [Nocardia terpenica]|uniref:MFS transporter n=1 Tax=Nocardia terpenica TaxID=455432 RepID=UPI001893AA9D|nr:MFS transporter [Nocardia terpenica]MBF6064279.1 MFS transporter [Nocardia terpenica]MBF6106612.1 MFS transporter [Nocardia terpenica]MBF6113897.1 MFS transporter [Nocardia terpenica]MBF6120479.1 MFS transporter [Nocardia terpenica]MBF6154864.1 MFS transporter [Nocardia terpenica]